MDVIRAAVQLGLRAQNCIAISAGGTTHTYAQLLHSASSISAELKYILSIRKADVQKNVCVSNGLRNGVSDVHSLQDIDGTRVGIIAKPSAQFLAGMWATWLCRGIAVPLALSYPEAELMHVLSDAEVSVVLGTADYQDRLLDAARKSSSQFYLLPDIPSFESEEAKLDAGQYSQLLDQITSLSITDTDLPGLIIYTSGTTGKPKGVVHTHSGMNAQVKMLSKIWEYGGDDRFLHCLPLHHVHGLFNGLLAPLYSGATVEFLPKFSAKGIWSRWLESYPKDNIKGTNPVTVFTGVPTMYAYLLQAYRGMDDNTKVTAASAAKKLRLMMSGSSALPLPIMTEWEKVTGHRLLERYGMTEFGMALSNPYHGERKIGTVGKPLPGVEVKIVETDPDTPGIGELFVKSPSMFHQYWQRPEVTKDSFSEDGYFKTGDTVSVDQDGYYTILGRSSVDILKVGGYKLSALEIEAVLLEHPAIAECAVLGLPDEYYGEVICAVVVLSDDAKSKATGSTEPPLTLPQLRAWAKQRLAPYKTPSRLKIWDTMPRNAMGKVNKKELRKLLASPDGA